jgi:hypothetical protein
MSGIMRLVSALAAAAAVLVILELGGQIVAPGQIGVVTKAEAIIGRPLTPMSYAGVARRTVRRCAVGVYYC